MTAVGKKHAIRLLTLPQWISVITKVL